MTDRVVDALIESDDGAPMVLFSDVLPVLEALKQRGITIAICSNWGWDLETFLDATSVSAFVDAAVTSARAGFRKPHPGIYELMLASLGIDASETLFVGDSWHPDVVGPRARGISSVHICRGTSDDAPDLLEGTYRISSLGELLTLSPLAIAGDT
jgi:putative hydrolase of the HAD superfamily